VTIVCSCPDVEVRGEAGTEAARAGKHVYFDKPLAGDIDGCRSIAAAVDSAGIVSQMFSYVTSPWARRARAAAAEGRVGALRAVHAEVAFAKGFAGSIDRLVERGEPGIPRTYTFPDAKRELFDLGVYALSLALWVAGGRARSVIGYTANHFFREHAARGTDDFGCLVVQLEGGVVLTIVAGRVGWHSHPQDGVKRVVLSGTGGTAAFDAYERRVEICNADPVLDIDHPNPKDPMGMWSSTTRGAGIAAHRRWQATPDDAFRNDVHAFVDAVEGRVRPQMDARLAAHVTETLLTGYRSAALGTEQLIDGEAAKR
jgi:predicted dehydrogenase